MLFLALSLVLKTKVRANLYPLIDILSFFHKEFLEVYKIACNKLENYNYNLVAKKYKPEVNFAGIVCNAMINILKKYVDISDQPMNKITRLNFQCHNCRLSLTDFSCEIEVLSVYTIKAWHTGTSGIFSFT